MAMASPHAATQRSPPKFQSPSPPTSSQMIAELTQRKQELMYELSSYQNMRSTDNPQVWWSAMLYVSLRTGSICELVCVRCGQTVWTNISADRFRSTLNTVWP